MIIAIDGPSAAGKSTIAKIVASKLKFSYIDTGAMYRAVAWKLLDTRQPFSKAGEIAQNSTISFQSGKVLIDGKDVTDVIRTQEISDMASKVSAVPEVRTALVEQQRRMGQEGNVILDGRDIGSVVFPNAECKLFMTAALEVRAHRRQQELRKKGEIVDFETVRNDLAARDKRDSERPVSPLRRTRDAMLVDTTIMDINQVTKRVLTLINKKIKLADLSADSPERRGNEHGLG